MLEKIFSMKNFIFFCAIGLAAFSGYYSVFGIAKLFSGGSWSVIGMAAMLELSKLFVIAFLHRHYDTLSKILKMYLLLSATILMTITSIGVYGYLTNSYQETAKTIYFSENEIKLLNTKKNNLELQKTQIDTLIKQKTNNIETVVKMKTSQQNILEKQLSDNKGTRSINKLMETTDREYTLLSQEIAKLSEKSLSLNDSILSINNKINEIENSTFSSELGPLLYLSRLTNSPMDVVVNFFIIFIVIVLDPLAISLIIAANHIQNRPVPNDSHTTVTDEINTKLNDEVLKEYVEDEKNLHNQNNISIFNELENTDNIINENNVNMDETNIPSEAFKSSKPKIMDNPWNPKIPYKE